MRRAEEDINNVLKTSPLNVFSVLLYFLQHPCWRGDVALYKLMSNNKLQAQIHSNNQSHRVSGGQGYVKKGFLKRREKAVALKFMKDADIEVCTPE